VEYGDESYTSHEEYEAWKTEAEVANELDVDSDAIDVIYDEDGNERTEADVIKILMSDRYGYEFPDVP